MSALIYIRKEMAKLLSKAANRLSSGEVSGPSGTNAMLKPADNSEQRVRSVLAAGAPLVLIHGRAGTGKTTILKSLLNDNIRQAAVAFTGVAARNASGQTIHSLFGMPPRLFSNEELRPSSQSRIVLSHIERLIIDEISMVRADMIDGIDHVLRTVRGINERFGGVRLILIGDLLQLTPIVKNHERIVLEQAGYLYPHFFTANSLQALNMNVVELTKVFRQSDTNFLELLGDVRVARNIRDCVATLNHLCLRTHRNSAIPIILTAKNVDAEMHNSQELARLRGPEVIFSAIVEGVFDVRKDNVPVPQVLVLKKDARVMIARNDPGGRWVNGTVGTVDEIREESVFIRINDGNESVEIRRATWENHRYRYDPIERKIITERVGTYTQFPVQLAWALTVHKTQGLTLEDVRVDLGNDDAFATGQVYVALSRVKTIEGLSLKRPLTVADIKVDSIMLEAAERLGWMGTSVN